MDTLARWGLVIAFLGIVIGLAAQFRVLPPEMRRKYIVWFVISVLVMGVGTLMQQLAA